MMNGVNDGSPTCPRCGGKRWVCERHRDRAWTGEHQDHAPGAACPECNPHGDVDWLEVYAEVSPTDAGGGPVR